jgi:hypothetical protein
VARLRDWFRHPIRTLINSIREPVLPAPEPTPPPPIQEPPPLIEWPPAGFGEPIGEEPPPYFGNEVTLYDDYGEPISLTLQQWLDAARLDKEITQELYGLHPLSIMHMLEDLDLIDSEDWDQWREDYEATHGS